MDAAERKPELVGWGITDRCNLSCPHCFSSAGKVNRGELSTAACERIIDSLTRLGAERIGWTGGEPLLRKDLEHLIAYALERGIQSGITTNGVPLTRRRAESLKQSGVRAIQISLDATTPEGFQLIRAGTRREFELVLAAIESTRACEIPLHLAMLLGAATLDDARSFIEMARQYGARSVRFCGFVPWGHGNDSAIRRRLDLSSRLPELKEFIIACQAIESPIILFDPAFGPLPPNYDHHECQAGIQLLYITGTGDVYPCTAPMSPRFRVGNVNERSIEDIWNDPAMTAMAEYSCHHIEGVCRTCENLALCHGGCRGLTLATTGNLNASFPNCLALVPSTEGRVLRQR